jgi:nuclear cap-binding protein subunit 1
MKMVPMAAAAAVVVAIEVTEMEASEIAVRTEDILDFSREEATTENVDSEVRIASASNLLDPLLTDVDDDGDDRPARKHKYEEPVASRLRREILIIGEPPVVNHTEDVMQHGKRIAENFEDDQVRGPLLDTLVQLIAEQPLKIPFVAAIMRYANDQNADVTSQIVAKVAARAQESIELGLWRELKLMLRFLAILQDVFNDDGVFTILNELFNRAADQQSASQHDTTGLELVKIILLTLPYVMAYSTQTQSLNEKAQAILSKTDIITSVQHPLEDLVETFPVEDEARPFGYTSALELLQKQLQQEAVDGWKLTCLPRIYKSNDAEMPDADSVATNKQAFPTLSIPTTINPGPRPIFPENYFSMYADQDVETVPRVTNIAASLIRDAAVDTINILHFNRLLTAKFLIDLDSFFSPGTFAKRAIPFDKIKDIPEGESTWKPEDLIVDAIFAQLLALPSAEHKFVYYHSVITEACKLAPSAIAPTLGRAIRFLYRSVDFLDLEVAYRFLDWFGHHLSNFDFRWKWAEWIDDIEATNVSAKKAFIVAVIDKETRLSFTHRIKDTLPREYHRLISEGKEKELPEFKYNRPGMFMDLKIIVHS